MSSGEPPTGPSAARIGGFSLIGVGTVAALIGAVTVFTGNVRDSAQGAPAPPPGVSASPNEPGSSGTPAPSGTPDGSRSPVPPEEAPSGNPPRSAVPPEEAASPEPSPGQSGRPPAGQRPPADPAPQPPGDAAPGREKVEVRIYNNSTIGGLAHRAAEDFRRAGYRVAEVGNYSQGRLYTTTVYFRPGTAEEAAARRIAARFGARVEPRFKGIEKASPGVIVIVTKDYKGPAEGK